MVLRLEIGDGGLLYLENACLIPVTHTFGRSRAWTDVRSCFYSREIVKLGGSVTAFYMQPSRY